MSALCVDGVFCSGIVEGLLNVAAEFVEGAVHSVHLRPGRCDREQRKHGR